MNYNYVARYKKNNILISSNSMLLKCLKAENMEVRVEQKCLADHVWYGNNLFDIAEIHNALI